MSGWKNYTLTQSIEAHRDGWAGAWDAFVAALLRRPRFSVARDVTVSFWAKAEDGKSVGCSITQVQAESKFTCN